MYTFDLPVITSKFNWNVIRALRKIIKTYRIDLIYSPSSSGLSNALFASIGTRAKNIAYRGTQAKLKRFDPTYYLGILNPAVEHVVCETKDIEEYLSRFIARKRLTTSTKPFDIDWIKEAVRTPKQADDIPDDAFRCIYIGATKNRPFKGLTDLIDAFILLDDPRVHLTIVGEYGENDFQLAQQSKVSAQIHFLGQRSDAISFSGHVPVVYTSLAPGCLPKSRARGYGLFSTLYRNRHTGSKRLNHRRSHRIVSAAFFSSTNGGVYPLAYR